MKTGGQLVLVATPIGNLGDVSARVAEALRAADVIYCEDTRRSRQLLTHLKITGKKLVALHQHNEASRTTEIIDRLTTGLQVAVVSDAGMPVISDPGERLVAAVAAAGLPMTVIPGPNAALMALAMSGLPAERFSFEGFLPVRGPERRQRLRDVAASSQTSILYEAPQRLVKTIGELGALVEPERRLAIARELTKMHEGVWRGSFAETKSYLENQAPRGEYCLIIEGEIGPPELVTDDKITTALQQQIATGQSRKDAVASVAVELNTTRKRVYALALTIPDRH